MKDQKSWRKKPLLLTTTCLKRGYIQGFRSSLALLMSNILPDVRIFDSVVMWAVLLKKSERELRSWKGFMVLDLEVVTLQNYKLLADMIPELADLVDTGIVTKTINCNL